MLAVALTACTGRASAPLDDAAEQACAELAPVVDDVEQGRLEGPPLYRALQDVYDVARTSEADGFAEAAQRALTAAINQDEVALAERLRALRERCRLPG